MASELVGVRLNYKRGTLTGLGLLVVGLGFVGFLLALTPFESRRGIVRLMVSILGPEGMQMFVAAISLVMIAGGLRLFWLTFKGALAAEIGAHGILVRSTYYSGLLPWASVGAVGVGVAPGWGNAPMLVILRKDQAGLLLRLVGLENKIVIQRKFLNADDDEIKAWIEAAHDRANALHAGNAAAPGAPA